MCLILMGNVRCLVFVCMEIGVYLLGYACFTISNVYTKVYVCKGVIVLMGYAGDLIRSCIVFGEWLQIGYMIACVTCLMCDSLLVEI